MRVLIAPDDFKGTLSASEAARAIARGWSLSAPQDALTLMPLSDGGPGFVLAIAAALDAELVPVGVRGPMGETAIGMVAMMDRTAYVESAHGCGLALVHPDRRKAGVATSYGVGQLIAAAIDSGATRVVVGLGGTASTDGGAGMLAALGATAANVTGEPVALDSGGTPLAGIATIDLGPALDRLGEVELIAASDVDAPLLGPHGAARGFAPQKGADAEEVEILDAALEAFAKAAGSLNADQAGAGAAGGLGFGLALLGARRISGIDVVREALGLDEALEACDLVVTGEGSFDWQSLHGKAVTGVAAAALEHGRPVVVIAGRVGVGRREYAALGITEAHEIGEEPGVDPAGALARATARVAAQWSRPSA